MAKLQALALTALILALAPSTILALEHVDTPNDLAKRSSYDSYKIFKRKRNAHACIMSIVFIVLYPLGAISVHLPINRIGFLRRTYLCNKVPAMHMPIQLLGLVMMIGGMALGIRIAHDLDYLSHPTGRRGHIVVGLVVCSLIIAIQPAFGWLQHRHYKRTGGRSVFGLVHRWTGRVAIVLGMINNGLGFRLASLDVDIPTGSYVRNFVLLGILAGIWFALVIFDEFAGRSTSRVAHDGGEKGQVGAAADGERVAT